MRAFRWKPFGNDRFGEFAVEDKQIDKVWQSPDGFYQPENQQRLVGRQAIDIIDDDEELLFLGFERRRQLSMKLLNRVLGVN